jgi:hypothetical protein
MTIKYEIIFLYAKKCYGRLNRPKQEVQKNFMTNCRATHPCTAVVMSIIIAWVDELIHGNNRVRED